MPKVTKMKQTLVNISVLLLCCCALAMAGLDVERESPDERKLEVSDDFAFVGLGKCINSSNEKYDFFSVAGQDGGYSPDQCAEECKTRAGITVALMGFHLLYRRRYCFCLFEDGQLPNPCPSLSYCDSSGLANGEVSSSTEDSTSMECYRFFKRRGCEC